VGWNFGEYVPANSFSELFLYFLTQAVSLRSRHLYFEAEALEGAESGDDLAKMPIYTIG
jgi:hypothetical protein